MSCRSKAMHALEQCDCYFKPEDFLLMLDKEQAWFELLMRLSQRRRELYPHQMETEAITLMLRARARELRN